MKIEEQVLSREQMAHLEELGVDTSDASMTWVNFGDDFWGLFVNDKVIRKLRVKYIPTYTIGDLVEKLPKGIEGNYLYIKYCWEYGYERIYRRLYVDEDSHIERLYELFCWVAENHKELIK